MLENEVTGQQVLFYTEEEVQAKIAQVVTNLTETHTSDTQYQLVRERRNLHDKVYEAFRSMRDEVDEPSLVSMYNTVAEACGWDTITAFTKQYTVSVFYNGHEIGEFSDIEADDEDSAENIVLEGMDITAFISLDISYGNNSVTGDVDIDSWDLDTDAFTAEATEQE